MKSGASTTGHVPLKDLASTRDEEIDSLNPFPVPKSPL